MTVVRGLPNYTLRTAGAQAHSECFTLSPGKLVLCTLCWHQNASGHHNEGRFVENMMHTIISICTMGFACPS